MTETDGAGRQLHRLPEFRSTQITRPGCYLVTETGRLLRITRETLGWNIPSLLPERSWIACLSENPLETITTLRRVADESGYFVNF